MSATHVARVTREQGERLYRELGRGSFQFRPVDHAFWGAQGEDVSVVWYRSGKVVVQGKGLDVFVGRHGALLGEPAPSVASRAAPRDLPTGTGPVAGSDESGKGDYFGPLAVAAVLVKPGQEEVLRRLDVMDSKLVGDTRIRACQGALERELVTAVRVLSPELYNAEWEKVRNVNVLLGRLHAEVLNEVLAGVSDPSGCRIVVDRFGEGMHVTKHLTPEAKRASFTIVPRGEREPAVAAASFLARAAFLEGFEPLRADAGGALPYGASDPRIVPIARGLFREGGLPWLRKFAKLHFKTTKAVVGDAG